MTVLLIVKVLLWILCALITYLVVRRGFRGTAGTWTQIDRLYWGFFCMLYGPVMLVVVIIFILAMKLADTRWAKREARW